MKARDQKIIHYIANARIPTQRAHGLQIMKMCEAFAHHGISVELILPQRPNEMADDPFEYYQVKNIFSIKRLWTISLGSRKEPRGRIFYWIETITFAWSVFWYAALYMRGMIYFRFDRALLAALLPFLRRRNITCEVHFLVEGWWRRFLLCTEQIIVVNQEAKRYYDRFAELEEKVFVAPDGVSMQDFDIKQSKEELRKELNLPLNKKIALYTGYFYRWKGIETIVRSAEFLDSDTMIVLVGGAREDIKPLEKIIQAKKFTNVTIIKYQSYSLMPKYQRAADCLLVGGTLQSRESARFTSPLKLFEYMASGIPIVAPRTPALEEILHHDVNAYFVVPDDPRALAEGICTIGARRDIAALLAQRARIDAYKYEWSGRAQHILDFIKKRIEAPQVLYLFAGARRWMIDEWQKGNMADSQLIGLNYLWLYGIRARYYETPLMNRLRKIQFNLAQFAALRAMKHCDVLFLGSNLIFVFFVKYILRWQSPPIVFYNTFLTNTLKRNKKGIYAWIVRKAIALCDIVVCPSTSQKKFLESQGFDAQKIVFIPNGVDSNFFHAHRTSSDSLDSFVLAIGKDMGRDYQTLIEAMRSLHTNLFIIASPRNFCGISNLPPLVKVLYDLPQYETTHYLRDALFVVLPTFSEDHFDASDCSGQYVLLEAMAAGKLVIASERSTLNDYFHHGQNGWTVPAQNVAALRGAIAFFLEHHKERRRIATKARQTIEEHYTTTQLAEALSKIFQELGGACR